MEYIVFIHNNINTPTTNAHWDSFFIEARKSEPFRVKVKFQTHA